MAIDQLHIDQMFSDAERKYEDRLRRAQDELKADIEDMRYLSDHHSTPISGMPLIPDDVFAPGGTTDPRPFDVLAHTDTVVYLRNVNYLYGVTRLRGAWVEIDTLSNVTLVVGGDYDGEYSITAVSADMCLWLEFNNKDAEITLAVADTFPAPALSGTKWDYTEAMPLWYFPWDGTNSRIDWANRIDLRHSWQTVGF